MNTTEKEANDQRLIAAQIIWNLWRAGQPEQLRLLEIQARFSREDLCKPTHPAPRTDKT